jgi:hypothetical protein
MEDKKKLIKMYEDLAYKYGEMDIWEDDIAPNIDKYSYEELKDMYEEDKKFYAAREAAGGYF